MIETDKAYIAGIIDGEGSLMLISLHRNEFPAPCVSIASTTVEMLQYIKSTVGNGKIIRKKNYNTNKHKDCYSYILTYNQALNLIKEIYPYLKIESKRKRAILLLTKYKYLTPRNGRYSEAMLKMKEELYKEFIAIK